MSVQQSDGPQVELKLFLFVLIVGVILWFFPVPSGLETYISQHHKADEGSSSPPRPPGTSLPSSSRLSSP